MTMERWIEGQLAKGNSAAVEDGKRLLGKYGEIPLTFAAAPASNTTSSVEKPPQLDLRERTYQLLSKVRAPSVEERKSLVHKGFFFLPIEAKTLAQVVGEHPKHFWLDELEYINNFPYDDLRTYVPRVMEVAVNPKQLFLEDSFQNSFGKTQAEQLAMIEEYSITKVEKNFPDAKALMLPATVEAQADIAYFQMTKGEVLFRNGFVRALDRMMDSNDFARIGRSSPDSLLGVHGYSVDYGGLLVGAPLAVVFLQK